MQISFIGHACFMLKINGNVIYFDPYEISEPESIDLADVVLVTHDHNDHFENKSFSKIQ